MTDRQIESARKLLADGLPPQLGLQPQRGGSNPLQVDSGFHPVLTGYSFSFLKRPQAKVSTLNPAARIRLPKASRTDTSTSRTKTIASGSRHRSS
jgi:hypothetical protein